jgi:hypothetical protein
MSTFFIGVPLSSRHAMHFCASLHHWSPAPVNGSLPP